MKKTSKTAALVLAVVMLFGAFPLSFAESGAHTHSPSFVAAKESTCKEQGNIAYWECTACGALFTDESAQTPIESEEDVLLPLAAHNYEQTLEKNFSCETEGTMRYTCSVCGDTYTEPIPASGHAWKKWTTVTEATCTEGGLEQRVCKNDKRHVETRPTDPLGHNYQETITAPAANALGYTEHICSRCSDTFTDTYVAQTGKIAGFKCKARTQAAVALTWTGVSGVTGYQLQISNAEGTAWADAVATKANTYVFKGLAAGSNYKFRIRTFIKAPDGKNRFAPWVAIASPTLPAATTVKLAAASKAFTAQWGRKNVTGYQIQYATNAKFTSAKLVTIKTATTGKYVVKKLNAKTNYYVRVRTYKTIGNTNYFSAWSVAVKVLTK